MKKKLLIPVITSITLITFGLSVSNIIFASASNVSSDQNGSPLYAISLKLAKAQLEGKEINTPDPNRAKMKDIDPRCPPSWMTATCEEHPCQEETIDCTWYNVTCVAWITCHGAPTCDGTGTCSESCDLPTINCTHTCESKPECEH